MLRKFKLIIYYAVIQKLPHGRYLELFNSIRVFYLVRILKIMKYSDSARFHNNVYISNAKDVFFGKNCSINENVFIQGAIIGDNVMIAPNVAIMNATHKFEDRSIPIRLQGDSPISNPICLIINN